MAGDSERGGGVLRRAGHPLVLLVLTCAGFTTVASVVLAVKLGLDGFDEPGLIPGLWVKAVAFGIIMGASMLFLRKVSVEPLESPSDSDTRAPWWMLSIVVILVVLMIVPLLDEYPWTAPDELHHLVVARNLGVHHAYASGNPEAGFVYFDYYDSVGVTVLGPVALAFKALGVGVVPARLVIAGFYILLTIGVWFFVRGHWGARAAAVSVVTMTLGYGSVYFARSLYGEVPALAFFVWSMLAWERALRDDKGTDWGVLCGVLWGCAILAKTFMALSAFPIAAVWIADRLTRKSMRWRDVLLPTGGVLGVMMVWYGIVAFFSDLIATDVSMLTYYRHYLMFGLGSLRDGLGWFEGQPLYALGLLATAIWTIGYALPRSSSPAVWTLYLTAGLFVFWWLFFTPGTIPRYLWYSCAIAGLFMGPMLVCVWHALDGEPRMTPRRLAYLATIAVVAIPCALRLYEQANLIYRMDEAADERALATYFEALPEDAEAVTAFRPAMLAMDFMTGRVMAVVEEVPISDDKYNVVVYDRHYNQPTPEMVDGAQEIGRYFVLEKKGPEREQ